MRLITHSHEMSKLGTKRLGIILLALGVVIFVGSLAYWMYLVSYCGNAFSSTSTLTFCKSYFTDTQLSRGGLANSLPLTIEFLMIPGLILATGGVLLVARGYLRRLIQKQFTFGIQAPIESIH